MEINYLKVAKAAEFCAAHFSALLYSELWCQAKVQELENCQKTVDYLVGSTMLDFIFENEEECVGEALQNILRNVSFVNYTLNMFNLNQCNAINATNKCAFYTS